MKPEKNKGLPKSLETWLKEDTFDIGNPKKSYRVIIDMDYILKTYSEIKYRNN